MATLIVDHLSSDRKLKCQDETLERKWTIRLTVPHYACWPGNTNSPAGDTLNRYISFVLRDHSSYSRMCIE